MIFDFTFNGRKTLYILGYHLLVILFLMILLFYSSINFDLLFSYKILFNPLAYKSVFYYLYGYYGFLGIIFSHIICSVYILIALFHKTFISRRILIIHGLVPILGSMYGYFFSNKMFINFGFFGEILGYIFDFYFGRLKYIIFYLLLLFLLLIIVQLNNMIIILNALYLIIEKLKIVAVIMHFYKYFISWLLFFIPFLKNKYKSRNYINIESLINKSIYKDFYNVSKCNNIENLVDIKENGNKELLLPFECIKNGIKNHKNYIIEVSYEEKNLLLDVFNDFGIKLDYKISMQGPMVNTVIFTPDKNVKLSKIQQLLPDVGRIIGRNDIRFIYPLNKYPHSVAFEYANFQVNILSFLEYAYDEFFLQSSVLNLLLGVNSFGDPYYIDIAKAPHVLLAGTTGSGKSNILNLFIVGLIWKNAISEIRLILLDPKKSEFFLFASLPHLLIPISQSIKEIEDAVVYLVNIMEERYSLFNKLQCKNIYEYNDKFEKIPFIVMIIDEYADIVIQSKFIEIKIIRLLQMSRAAGIHIILATQRPSADIISSIVKSNLPMRIACKVINSINSRVVLDIDGAEKLLGNSDMLISFNNKYDRVHGLFVDNKTIGIIVKCFDN